MSEEPWELINSLLRGEDLFSKASSQEEIEDIITSLKRALEGNRGMRLFLSPEGICLLRRGLQRDTNRSLRLFSLEQLARFVEHEEGLSALLDSEGGNPPLNYFFDAFFDKEDLKSYVVSKNALLKLAKNFDSRAIELLFTPSSPYLERLTVGQRQKDELIRFRFLEFFASLATLSEAFFGVLTEKNEFLQAILKELENSDFLVRLNAFVLISTFCQSDRAADFLNKIGTTNYLLNMLDEEGKEGGSKHSMLLSNLICLLGEIFSKSEYFYLHLLSKKEKKFKFFQVLSEYLCSEEEKIILAALFCVSKLCTTENGLSDILNQQTPYSFENGDTSSSSCLTSAWFQHAYSLTPDIRTASFKYLAMVWDKNWSEHFATRTNENLLHHLYLHAGEGQECPLIVRAFRSVSREALEEKYAAMEVIRGLSRYSWGLEVTFKCNGLPEWILDRSTESTKLGHELKYSIVESVTSNPQGKAIVGSNYYYRFTSYLRQGVFYRERDYAIAIKDTVG